MSTQVRSNKPCRILAGTTDPNPNMDWPTGLICKALKATFGEEKGQSYSWYPRGNAQVHAYPPQITVRLFKWHAVSSLFCHSSCMRVSRENQKSEDNLPTR